MHLSDFEINSAVTRKKVGDNLRDLPAELSVDYPAFSFVVGHRDYWSPKTNTIFYDIEQNPAELHNSLLHELSHALLGHQDYESDFELLRKEADAWHFAQKLGKKYDIIISDEHIQNCLDTYRDWLHRRSTCPDCQTRTVQKNSKVYRCFNCGCEWKVANEHFSRTYRLKAK